MRLSEHELLSPIDLLNAVDNDPFLVDIGGTNGETGWEDTKNYSRARAYLEIGTWNATDDVDESKIQSGTTSSGGTTAEVTTDASGGDYDTDNPIDADGDFIVTEIRMEDMAVDSSARWIRYYIAEGGNTGVDNAGGLLSLYGYAYPQKELQGAATTGSKVYVQP